jgi:hypothetical protein
MKTEHRRRKPVKLLLCLLPVLALPLLLLAVLGRDIAHKPTPQLVTVVVRSEPEVEAPPIRTSPPVYKATVKDEIPEFDRSLATPLPVKVSIIDDKEERPPVKVLPVKVEIKDEGDGGFVPGKAGKPVEVDQQPRVLWQYSEGMRYGIGALETKKLLTFAANGATNQTLLRVNGQIGEFGGPLGRFVERDTKLPADPSAKTYGGSKSVWVSGKLHYTQILELVASKQPVTVSGQSKMLLDTVQVRYLIENKDMKTYRAGLRTQLDTLIGGNDGVPFAVPGLPGMVTTFADFPRLAPIPDFIQALERPNLRDPGTVAHLSLKLGGGIEPPARLSLTHWPGLGYPNWDVPLMPLAGDSAVVLYWNDKPVAPGEIREMGFAYGLGSVASSDPGGKLGVTLGGSFEPGEAFTVTAYVQGPQKGQTLTLELPQGLERLEGNLVEEVPPLFPGAPSSIVTWKVKVLETGTFPLKVASSNGLCQAKTISIGRPEGTPELRLTLDVAGSFEPGQECTVEAKLASSGTAPQAEPTLKLPPGLGAVGGPLLNPLPASEGKGSVTVATWKVKVKELGTHTVRVEWSGAAAAKTLNIARPSTPSGGYVAMALSPPFAPGKAFTVTAAVSNPLPGQTLTLPMPAGLRLLSGMETMPVELAQDSTTVVTWHVLVEQPGTYPLRLVSSAGQTLKKTITIEQDKSKGGGDFKLDCLGDIAPGKEFTVRAKVDTPVAGQQLTLLQLPASLELVDGPTAKTVPPPTDGLSEVTWRLRVLETGSFPVRVASTTGVVRSVTITISVDQPSGGGPRIFGGKR